MNRHAGDVPAGKADLEALPGIGHYIAAAVRCFAFGYPDAVVDTNTVRIASRVFGFRVNDSSRRNRAVHQHVKGLVSPTTARESNLALLDLGALVCTARKPACESCPVRAFCITGRGFAVESTLEAERSDYC
jgi:A/G-specific adenine glycosylase